MINFKNLCNELETTFSGSLKRENLMVLMTRIEIKELEKNAEVYIADNEKWMLYWFNIKKAVIGFGSRNGTIGSIQLRNLIAPIKYQILGRAQ